MAGLPGTVCRFRVLAGHLTGTFWYEVKWHIGLMIGENHPLTVA